MKRLFAFIVLVTLIIGVNFVLPIVVKGVDMYQTALKDKPLTEYVNEIKSRENYTTLDDINPVFINALIHSEDTRFYSHPGFDLISLTRAFVTNIKEGKKAEGGSTITQQLAKNMYFTFEKKYERKIAELLVALELEKNYSKDEIIELYVNIINFGEDCFGIKTASIHYFNKLPSELNSAEIDALVYTIKSPNNYNPNKLNLSFSN
ncbi:biosynthetic peptidoglycan transglycosylase [Anaerorhabdus sp.]|uniref:biosynthetic peptidoglycan transglycosylase n=2 Tax=Anaerorhabdus sp. TaxID=1872524 RepID=UPI002B209ADB|nr:biosynthetic peptidoglycan transglycosylase [Anaerorhabdus sp.]MEA4874905.1 biosynthetic peptidoglycan transglycosylase [Anaerorhabdus sp.]